MDFANALAGVTPAPPDPGLRTAPLGSADGGAAGSPSQTKRLNMMTVYGTAQAVHKRPEEPGQAGEFWTFRVERYESTGVPHTVVPVEFHGASADGQLSDGDVVEVDGIWDGRILSAETVVNHSVRPGKPRRPAVAPSSAVGRPSRKPARSMVMGTGVVAVAAILAVALVLTHGFGLWSTSGPGPALKPQRATVFSPGAPPDHPDDAGNAIDGNPNTAWPTDVYVDADPFPAFKQGVGLILQLPEPSALSAVTVDVPSTGTQMQIRAADSATPASISDTTALTQSVPLQPGHNRIPVDNRTKTANVLLWITKLGTTNGQSRTSISDVTLEGVG